MTEHRDPAVEAAERVRRRYLAGPGKPWSTQAVAEDAAREALAPIRELHKPTSNGTPRHPEPYCVGCADEWPCQTAKLIYSSSEVSTCPKTARTDHYLLTCCRDAGHDGDCWCSDVRVAEDEDGAGDE